MLEKSKITEFYNLYKKELLIYIYRFTGSTDISEDILHDCFINLINYSKTHDIKEYRSFLYKTAHNLCMNFFNKNKKYDFTPIGNRTEIKHNDDTSLKLDYEELNKEIYSILNELDELSRSIFILKKEQNLKLMEIAEITGKSERTIRRKLKQITDFLMNRLEKSGFL